MILKKNLKKFFSNIKFVSFLKGFIIGTGFNLGICLLIELRLYKKRNEIANLEDRLYFRQITYRKSPDGYSLSGLAFHIYLEAFYSKLLSFLDKL